MEHDYCSNNWQLRGDPAAASEGQTPLTPIGQTGRLAHRKAAWNQQEQSPAGTSLSASWASSSMPFATQSGLSEVILPSIDNHRFSFTNPERESFSHATFEDFSSAGQTTDLFSGTMTDSLDLIFSRTPQGGIPTSDVPPSVDKRDIPTALSSSSSSPSIPQLARSSIQSNPFLNQPILPPTPPLALDPRRFNSVPQKVRSIQTPSSTSASSSISSPRSGSKGKSDSKTKSKRQKEKENTWDSSKDVRLRELFLLYPKKWKFIGKQLNEPATSCEARWNKFANPDLDLRPIEEREKNFILAQAQAAQGQSLEKMPWRKIAEALSKERGTWSPPLKGLRSGRFCANFFKSKEGRSRSGQKSRLKGVKKPSRRARANTKGLLSGPSSLDEAKEPSTKKAKTGDSSKPKDTSSSSSSSAISFGEWVTRMT